MNKKNPREGWGNKSRKGDIDPQRCSIKKAALKNLTIFKGKYLCWSLLFNKVAGHQTCNFIKKKLQQRCFPVNITKFLRGPILKNICERLLLLCNRISIFTE